MGIYRGGGAGAVGGNASDGQAGAGGVGVPNNILGPATSYAGGGGGGGRNPESCAGGASPCCTGGAGSKTAAGAVGTANTGGGGGGGGFCGGYKSGGNGGSGIVIVKVPVAYTVAASPTPARALSTHPDGEQLVKFTASGTLTIS